MNPQNPNPNAPRACERGAVRPPLVALAVVAAVVCVGAMALFLRSKPTSQAAPPAESANAPARQTEPIPVETPPAAATPRPATQVATPPPARTPLPGTAPPTQPRPEPSPATRQLVASLSVLATNGPITDEKAAQWKQSLQALVQEGAGAIPAIREYLEQNLDVNFKSGDGTNLLGEPSLRMALLHALQAIGGAEAVGLCAQTIQTTADPREIALLARYLDQQAPEQYRQAAVDAARAALAMAGEGKLGGRDVGPLFDVLTQYGGANAVADLQNAVGQWRYYAAIALGNLPDGSGLPALMQMVQDPGASAKGNKSVALQMLAQWATQSPDVRNVLLEQARLNQVPNATWINVAAVLGGDRYAIGDLAAEGIQPVSGERRWHLAGGQQTFYSRPAQINWTPEEVNQRLGVIDQLLAQSLDPMAKDALQRARATVQGKLPQ